MWHLSRHYANGGPRGRGKAIHLSLIQLFIVGPMAGRRFQVECARAEVVFGVACEFAITESVIYKDISRR